MSNFEGIPRENREGLATRSADRADKFFLDNLPGYNDCSSKINREMYIILKAEYDRQKFDAAEKQSIDYALWYNTIEYSRTRTKLEEDIKNINTRGEVLSEATRKMVGFREANEPSTSGRNDADLRKQIKEDLEKEGADPIEYILNLRKTANEDEKRIRALENAMLLLDENRRREEVVIQTPRRPPEDLRMRSLRITGRGESRPPNSAMTDGRPNRTLVGDEVNQENDDEEEEINEDEIRRREAERQRAQETDNRALRDAQISNFSGAASDEPYGNNFAKFLFVFEEHAGFADERTKKLVLTQKLRGKAQKLYLNKIEETQEYLDYTSIVELMKSVFYPIEVDSSKLKRYNELRQRDDQLLDDFYITFKIYFRDFLEVTTGQKDETMGNGKMMCRGLYNKVRPVLREAMSRKWPYLWEEWNQKRFTIEQLYVELKALEAALPPRPEGQKLFGERKQPYKPFQPRTQYAYQQPAASSLGKRCFKCGGMNHTQSECRVRPRTTGTNQETPFPPRSKGESIRPQMNRPQVNRDKRTPDGKQVKKNFDPARRYGGSNNQTFKSGGQNRNTFGQNGGQRNNWGNNQKGGSNNSRSQQSPYTQNKQNAFGQNIGQRINATENTKTVLVAAPPPSLTIGQSNTYPVALQTETATPLSMFNYSQTTIRDNKKEMKREIKSPPIRFEIDEDTPFQPEHSAKMAVFKCFSTRNGWNKISRFALWKCNLVSNDNPPWIREQNEESFEECDDAVEWAKTMRDYQDNAKWSDDARKRITRNREVRDQCVDTIQFRFALIILDVYIEDVLYDTGSMYNAISRKAFCALAGRFDSFMKAFSEANWDPHMKTVSVVGGDSIPVLATVELETQTSTGKIVPIVWAIYDDVDYIIIIGTSGMRALNFQCKTPELNNYDLFKSKSKSEEIAAKLYEPAIVPIHHLEVGEDNTPCLKPETAGEEEKEESSSEEEDIEQLLMSNEAALKFIADAATLGPFVTPDERNSILGGLLLETALDDYAEPLIELESVKEEDFRPENISDGEKKDANENALIGALNNQLEMRDFPLVSLEPKPPNFCE